MRFLVEIGHRVNPSDRSKSSPRLYLTSSLFPRQQSAYTKMKQTRILRQLAAAARRSVEIPHTLNRPSLFIRPFGPNATAGPSRPNSLESDFQLYPDFFHPGECRQLLGMALWKLDRVDTTRRRRKNRGLSSDEAGTENQDGLQNMFEGDYGFEEVCTPLLSWRHMLIARQGHYDSVIHHFRETLVSNFPPPDKAWPDLLLLMNRIYDLLPPTSTTSPIPSAGGDTMPPRCTSTHVLHLAPHGAILPHVDNLEASGSVIIGTSLGAERILRLKDKEGDDGWDVKLPSGSLYVQR